MSDIPRAPSFEDDDDAALNAQVIASVQTLVMLLIFCGGVALGYVWATS